MDKGITEKGTWKNVCDSVPPVNKEVIVMDAVGRIAFGHQVDKRYCKDYDGWNLPGVLFWMPCGFTEEMVNFYISKELVNSSGKTQ